MCLAGGVCADLGCPHPDMAACGPGGIGVCILGSASSFQPSICILGCDTSADCPSGNNCVLVGTSIGGHAGYCIDACTNDGDCALSDVCQTRPGDPSTSWLGHRCAPRCALRGGIGPTAGCAVGQACVAAGMGSTGLACAPIDSFCGAADAFQLPGPSDQCATGYVCDELAIATERAVVADGRCIPACTSDAVCATGTNCVTSGKYGGLCRAHCRIDSDCPSSEVCDRAEGWCVEVNVAL